MSESLRRLFASSLDYAGLFPPAALPLPEAWGNYCRFQQSPETAWLLRSFVCSVVKLVELAEQPHVPAQVQLHLSLIGSPFSRLDDAENVLRGDVAAAREFMNCVAPSPDAGWRISYEFSLPPAAFEHPSRLPRWCDCLNRAATASSLPLECVFLEVPWSIDAAVAAEDLAGFLGRTNGLFGLKFRTGGADAAAFPTSKQLAAAIFACQHAGVPWKATAGLHHPLPRDDEALGAKMHGFVNLSVAAVLARKYKLTAVQLREILKETAPEAFQFDDRRLRWRDHSAKLADIEGTRTESLISFGSCSVEEPLEGLRQIEEKAEGSRQ